MGRIVIERMKSMKSSGTPQPRREDLGNLAARLVDRVQCRSLMDLYG